MADSSTETSGRKPRTTGGTSIRTITPSKITAWLDCAHFLTLKHQVEDGLLSHPGGGFGSFSELLADKGVQHEMDCLAEYEGLGKTIFRIPERLTHERFESWVARIGDPFAGGPDVIYQMPLIHEGIRGIADFLIRVEGQAGEATYEPVDAKLVREAAKPGHVLQLCFYADAIESLTGSRPRHLHLWLGSGRMETLTADDYLSYWNRLRSQLSLVLGNEARELTDPEPCNHCDFCEFTSLCTDQWRERDSLIYIAGIRKQERDLLEAGGVTTVSALAECSTDVSGLRSERLSRIVGQAALQVEARSVESGPPPFRLIEPSEDPVWGRGFSLMPKPDDGDIFLDFEGHPFWRADSGLFFLFGLTFRSSDGEWRYKKFWAHDRAEEAIATQELIDLFVERRLSYPDMHVYHYNHTERSSLEKLALDHGVGEVALAELVDTGLFVDLLVVAKNALQAGTESYGLKHLERLTDYERGHDIDKGAGAVVEYEGFMKTRDPEALERIAAYNEDDVRATKALRDWLVEQRPADAEWRSSWLDPDDEMPELDEQVTALHEFTDDTPEHLLGDLLGYWRRERRAYIAPKIARCQEETTKLLDDPEVLAGLTPVGLRERIGSRGQAINPVMEFELPEQAAGSLTTGRKVIYSVPDGPTGYSSIDRIDPIARRVTLVWNARAQELGVLPSVVILDDWFDPKPKPGALGDFADRVIDKTNGSPTPVSMALLRGDPPAFTKGFKFPGSFADDLEEMLVWVHHLDNSCVAVQGPPGTGKTYRGSHLIRSLIKARKRVGITAMSHYAVDNLLEAVVELFEKDPDDLRAVKKGAEPPTGGLPGVKYVDGNPAAARDKYNLVAGTTWLFSNEVMRNNPVDVLIIDEAGQLALADAVAASGAARNLVLLGDPLQLPQVAQASHPGGGGMSVLKHILGEDATIPPERGVFIETSRRMHADICSFISEQIYEGRLSSHPSCSAQATEFGTGLRWLRAHHAGRTTASPEEAVVVAEELQRLIGTKWIDQRGVEKVLKTRDFMVVAPYNDQARLIREHLDNDVRTRGIPVGTVDKFQGREAAVVFFTMTTSSSGNMTRNADFLFSRNRLNVAVSRARCLAYLVCTEELLNSRARSVPEMRLISTLCSFVEYAQKLSYRDA